MTLAMTTTLDTRLRVTTGYAPTLGRPTSIRVAEDPFFGGLYGLRERPPLCRVCSDRGSYLVQRGVVVTCTACPRGAFHRRLATAEKWPGADPEADALLADYAVAAMEP